MNSGSVWCGWSPTSCDPSAPRNGHRLLRSRRASRRNRVRENVRSSSTTAAGGPTGTPRGEAGVLLDQGPRFGPVVNLHPAPCRRLRHGPAARCSTRSACCSMSSYRAGTPVAPAFSTNGRRSRRHRLFTAVACRGGACATPTRPVPSGKTQAARSGGPPLSACRRCPS